MVPSSLATDLSDEAMTLVANHFADAAEQAWKDAARYFVSGREILESASLPELAAEADDVLQGRSVSVAPGRTLEDNLVAVAAYYDALADMIEELQRYQDFGRPITADLTARAQVLRDVALSVEESFTWINTYFPILFAYYQSFSLWTVRGIFLDMAARVAALEQLVEGRVDEYRALEQKLAKDLAELREEIVDPHKLLDDLRARSRRPRGGSR
jgi:hypothetical protein